MEKNVLFTVLLCGLLSVSFAQSWVQKANLGGVARQGAVAFTIGNYGYVGLGMELPGNGLLKDYWKYDPTTNSWTQIANFGGTVRFGATGFVVGNKAYVGTGTDQYPTYNFRTDFWEYDPTTNTWTQIADFPGNPRYSGNSLTIGTKGYTGLGWDQVTPWYGDFYEYDPAINTWTQKSDFRGGPRQDCVSFTIGNYGYIGTGYGGTCDNDFWQYDPTADSWTQVASLPGTGRYGAAAFVLNNKAYVGLGSYIYPSAQTLSDFYEYDPVTNSWTTLPDFIGPQRLNEAAFSIGCVGYVCTGSNVDYSQFYQDLWAYATSVAATITGTPDTLCVNAPVAFTSNETGATSYQWQFGDGMTDTSADPTHMYNSPGIYNAIFIAQSSGCAADTLSQIIQVDSSPHAAFINTTSSCGFTTSFNNSSSGFTSFLWNFGDGTTSDTINPIHTYQINGTYSVYLVTTNAAGCRDTAFLQIISGDSSSVDFLTTERPCNARIIFDNTSVNAYTSFWDFGDGSTSAVNSPIHSYDISSDFTVTLTINKGTACEEELAKVVQVSTANASDLFVPNAFTPNNDGLNDLFIISTISDCDTYELLIFNRWGELIYTTTSQPLTWNGTYKGKHVPIDSYVYLIKGLNTGLVKTGIVNVVK